MRTRVGMAAAAAVAIAASTTGTATATAAAAPHGGLHYGAGVSSKGRAFAGRPVQIALALTLPHGDRLAHFTLDFGDHTRAARGAKLPGTASHTYPRAGRYVVTLLATDRHRRTWRAHLTETVTGTPVTGRGGVAGGAATDPGTSPSGLPNPPAGCNGTSTPGVNAYDTTPAGAGPWTVPLDPCNSEGIGDTNDDIYADAGYWAAEKRPDVWSRAVLPYGYADDPYGPWNIEEDAARAGFPIDATPRAGDLAVWNDGATMGVDSTGTEQDAGPGGQVAYVEAVDPDGTIVISGMGAGAEDGGYTYTLAYDPGTNFIHRA